MIITSPAHTIPPPLSPLPSPVVHMAQGEQTSGLPRSYSADSLEETGGRCRQKVQREVTGVTAATAAAPNAVFSPALPAPATTSSQLIAIQQGPGAWPAVQAQPAAQQGVLDAASAQQQQGMAPTAAPTPTPTRTLPRTGGGCLGPSMIGAIVLSAATSASSPFFQLAGHPPPSLTPPPQHVGQVRVGEDR